MKMLNKQLNDKLWGQVYEPLDKQFKEQLLTDQLWLLSESLYIPLLQQLGDDFQYKLIDIMSPIIYTI